MSHLNEVQAKLLSQVPLIGHMGVKVCAWDGATVELEAPLEPNLNTHGTAFGGSLYCIGAMTGWSAVHLTLLDAGYDPSVWLVKGEVEYKKPVRGILRARATISPEIRDHLVKGYLGKGKVKAAISITLLEGDELAVAMQATYAAMQQDPKS